jgi:hypothetical protein
VGVGNLRFEGSSTTEPHKEKIMNNFNFGEVLTRAWKIIWKHKVLWIFGILASCARRSGGSGNGGGNYRTGSGGNSSLPSGQFERVLSQVGNYIGQHLWIIVVVVLVLILLSLIFYALGIMGRTGLIKGTSMAEKGAEKLSFGEIWSESLPYFWRIFWMNFLIGLAFFIVIGVPLILLVVMLAMGGMTGGARAGMAGMGILGLFACLIPIICLLIPIGWVVSLIVEQAQAAIVLEELGISESLKRGWLIVKSNVGPVIIMALILGIGGGIIGVIFALPIIIAIVPILVGMGALRQSLMPVYISLACCAVYLPVLIFLNGVLTAYIQSAWTLTFMRLAQPKEDAPIMIEANA